MRIVPLVSVFEPDSHQVRSDAPRAEKMRYVESELARLRHRAPAAGFAGHRTHELGMAIPATLAQIHVAAALFERRVVGCSGQKPLELTEIGADHGGDLIGARRGFEEGQEALGAEGQEEEQHAGH